MLNPVFLFDERYLGPALVSAASFLATSGAEGYPLTLLFMSRADDEADLAARGALIAFAEATRARRPQLDVRLVVLRATVFDQYRQRFHFSSAIMYKIVLPEIFPDYGHIVLFDCGMLFGRATGDFLAALEARIVRADLGLIAAYCCVAEHEGALAPHLQSVPHNRLYPSVVILYFDVARCAAASLYPRILAGFAHYRDILLYGEQDLLCLVLREGELGDFEPCDDRLHIDMADEASWMRMDEYQAAWAAKDYFYLKHIGSFKPWKKWILHPTKGFYLCERERLRTVVDAPFIPALEDPELAPSDVRLAERQLRLLEAHYARSVQ
jgi:lipopolysaccharide biosynthesis glycosyltransferase